MPSGVGTKNGVCIGIMFEVFMQPARFEYVPPKTNAVNSRPAVEKDGLHDRISGNRDLWRGR